MKIREGIRLDFDDVLLLPKRTTTASRKDVEVEREFQFYHSPRKWEGVPIFAANMFATGSLAMAAALEEEKCCTALHKFNDKQKILDVFLEKDKKALDFNEVFRYTWVSVGTKPDDVEKLKHCQINTIPPNICIDVANGYSGEFVDYCAWIRSLFPSSIIMAGNVATPEMVQELIINGGVDIVKVGIGPGSVCTTRIQTGVGVPQLSAISDCATAAHGLKSGDRKMGLICGDGGCKTPGDVCKAFAAGADFTMLGGMLAGASECDGVWRHQWRNKLTGNLLPSLTEPVGPISEISGKEKHSLRFYGMSSGEAQEKHGSGVPNYAVSEGKEIFIAHKGPVRSIIECILGGLRSCCTYTGATSLKDLPKCAEFIRVNNTHNRVFEQ